MGNGFRTIKIRNISMAYNHFLGESQIESFLDSLLYDKDNSSELLIHNYLQHSPRIRQVSFYNNGKTKIAILYSDLTEKEPKEDFSKEISITSKDGEFSFSFFELPLSKYARVASGEISLPKGWKKDEVMNKNYDKMGIF